MEAQLTLELSMNRLALSRLPLLSVNGDCLTSKIPQSAGFDKSSQTSLWQTDLDRQRLLPYLALASVID